jgi:MFS family permease
VVGIGLSFATIFPTTIALLKEGFPLSGKLTGRFFACSSGGAMIMPWLIGQFFESSGAWVMSWTVLVGLVAGCRHLCLDDELPAAKSGRDSRLPERSGWNDTFIDRKCR